MLSWVEVLFPQIIPTVHIRTPKARQKAQRLLFFKFVHQSRETKLSWLLNGRTLPLLCVLIKILPLVNQSKPNSKQNLATISRLKRYIKKKSLLVY